MFDKLFPDAGLRAWLGSATSAPHIRTYAMALRRAGAKSTSLRQRVHTAAHLAYWIEARDLALQDLDEGVLERFRGHFAACTCERSRAGEHEHTAVGATRFLQHLRAEGIVAYRADAHDPGAELMERFINWLERHRGVTASTVAGYRSHISAVLDGLGPEPGQYDVASVRRFILAHLSNYNAGYAKSASRALRMFLRFLVAEGLCPPELVDAVPKIANWILAEVPRHLPPESIERVISSTGASRCSGVRDRAIVLLLARLGLRARDILELRLGDLDWGRGLVRVMGKGRRETWLPLPQDAGDAVLEYLENARPSSSHEHLFLRARAPFGPFKTSSTIAWIVRRALERAEIEHPGRTATHLFRHSLARRLLAHDVPLEAIGVVLRHRSLETSAKYAKIDAPTLKTVVQSWPGEREPC